MYPFAKDTKVMLGVVWPDKHVGFPDFLDPTNGTNAWWIREFSEFHETVNVRPVIGRLCSDDANVRRAVRTPPPSVMCSVPY